MPPIPLRETDAVICEADLDDFGAIHATLAAAGLALHDVTTPMRLSDRSLGWFYPVYISKRLDWIRQRAFWDRSRDAAIVQMQIDRRKAILDANANMLAALRAQRGQG